MANRTRPFIGPIEINDRPILVFITLYLLPPIALVTVVVNSISVYILLKKSMRIPSNIILASIAVTHMIKVIVFSYTSLAVYATGAYLEYMLYEGCFYQNLIFHNLTHILHKAAVWLTVFLAAQRYIFVATALKSNRLTAAVRRRLFAIVGILVILILVVLVQLPRLYDTEITGRWVPSKLTRTPPACSGINKTLKGTQEDVLDKDLENLTIETTDASRIILPPVFPTEKASHSLSEQEGVTEREIHLVNSTTTKNYVKNLPGACQQEDQINTTLVYACFARTNPDAYFRSTTYYTVYTLAETTVNHLLTCILLICLNALLVRFLRAAEKKHRVLRSHNSSDSNGRSQDGQTTTLLLCTVTGVMVLCELTSAIYNFLTILEFSLRSQGAVSHGTRLLSETTTSRFLALIHLFIYISSPINFFILCAMSDKFRQELRHLFRRILPSETKSSDDTILQELAATEKRAKN